MTDTLELQEAAGSGLPATTGYASFADLCETLIDDYHWLHPTVERTTTEWSARIYTHPENHVNRLCVALGTGSNMDAACGNAVTDFHERARIRARKEELLTDPNVQEALKLFGHNAKDVAAAETDSQPNQAAYSPSARSAC